MKSEWWVCTCLSAIKFYPCINYMFQFGFSKNIYHVMALNACVGFSVGKLFLFGVSLINDLLVEINNVSLVPTRNSGLLSDASHGLLGRPEICASIRYSLCCCWCGCLHWILCRWALFIIMEMRLYLMNGKNYCVQIYCSDSFLQFYWSISFSDNFLLLLPTF